jgi:hypothetical protein
LATFGAIFAEVSPHPAGFPNNCEIWIQGPEPFATRIADASTAAYPGNVVNGLQTDAWYDLYAKAPSDAPGNYSYVFTTANFGPTPAPTPCCGNPVVYHFWDAKEIGGFLRVRRNSDGGFHNFNGNAGAAVPAGTTRWLASVYVVHPTNTVQPANPVPVPPPGSVSPSPTPTPPPGGGGGGFPWPDLGSLTTEQLLLIGAAAVGVIVLIAVAGGGDD